jgi:hypothetical protein
VPTGGAALVTFVNNFPAAVVVEVNGVKLELGPGEQKAGVRIVPAPSGNDVVSVGWKAVPTCGIGDAMGYFVAGFEFTFTVITGTGRCGVNNQLAPDFHVSPALLGVVHP